MVVLQVCIFSPNDTILAQEDIHLALLSSLFPPLPHLNFGDCSTLLSIGVVLCGELIFDFTNSDGISIIGYHKEFPPKGGIGCHLKYKLEVTNKVTPVQKNFQQAKKKNNEYKGVREEWINNGFRYAFRVLLWKMNILL